MAPQIVPALALASYFHPYTEIRIKPTPDEMLLEEFLQQLGLRRADAAQQLGISANRLNEVVLGKRRITADTALRLSGMLTTSPQFWMRLQADWDLHRAAQRAAS